MVIYNILNDMERYLSLSQLKQLQIVLLDRMLEMEGTTDVLSDDEYIRLFLDAKRIEGCSERTLAVYESTIRKMCRSTELSIPKITTQVLRDYISEYQKNSNCSKVTVDNVRRNLSSFFSWLEEENYITRNPVRRIHKIKTKSIVRETISDENIELLRDSCSCSRDRAIIDFLYSTGIRIGEMVNLNISDLNFEERECIVYGKGDRERKVYFDAKAKIHIKEYLQERTDENPALFVSLYRPYERLGINGVESRLRNIGRKIGLDQIHPHKLRRTFATRAIDKGMPIEQVQKILGHKQIDTTLKYAMVNQNNVKQAHRKIVS